MDLSSVGDRQVDGSTCAAVVSCLQQARDHKKKKISINNNNNNSNNNSRADRSIIDERKSHLGQIPQSRKKDPYQELELYLARVIVSLNFNL